jgi:hypothetical protein
MDIKEFEMTEFVALGFAVVIIVVLGVLAAMRKKKQPEGGVGNPSPPITADPEQ